jgi:hypothetical protein
MSHSAGAGKEKGLLEERIWRMAQSLAAIKVALEHARGGGIREIVPDSGVSTEILVRIEGCPVVGVPVCKLQ